MTWLVELVMMRGTIKLAVSSWIKGKMIMEKTKRGYTESQRWRDRERGRKAETLALVGVVKIDVGNLKKTTHGQALGNRAGKCGIDKCPWIVQGMEDAER